MRAIVSGNIHNPGYTPSIDVLFIDDTVSPEMSLGIVTVQIVVDGILTPDDYRNAIPPAISAWCIANSVDIPTISFYEFDGGVVSQSKVTGLTAALSAKANTSSLATVATTGSYNDLSNKPSIPAAQVQSDWNQASSGAVDFIKNKPTIPTIPSRSFNNAPGRSIVTGTGATGFQISSTRDASVSYSPTIVTTATIGGGSSGSVVLEICSTNSSTPGDWIEISRMTNGQVITLALTLQSVQTISSSIVGTVPAGYYAKIRSINNTGTPSYSINSQQEVLL